MFLYGRIHDRSENGGYVRAGTAHPLPINESIPVIIFHSTENCLNESCTYFLKSIEICPEHLWEYVILRASKLKKEQFLVFNEILVPIICWQQNTVTF
jgi:hypothetical protein